MANPGKGKGHAGGRMGVTASGGRTGGKPSSGKSSSGKSGKQ